jgi:hypothetical protein
VYWVRDEAANLITKCGDVLTGKSWPAAFGGAPTEHAEEIDHPAFQPLATSRDLPQPPIDSTAQLE